MGSIGEPVEPDVVFAAVPNGTDWLNSQALVVTFLLTNWPSNESIAKAWENEFLRVARANYSNVHITYSAER